MQHNALNGDQKWNLKKAPKRQKLYSFTIESYYLFLILCVLLKSKYLRRIMKNSIYKRNIFVQILLRIIFLLMTINFKEFYDLQDANAI